MVRYEGTKMSKSLGNLVFVRDLLKNWEPAAIRLAVLAHHYRSDWDWHDGLLSEAAARLDLWRGNERGTGLRGEGGLRGGGVLDDVRAALDDDLATPRALAAIDDAAGESSREEVADAAALLGVLL
jgi:L-cysteine:1D-myo-inositol 2-amino-2-deoxy-alpha-D-glucopyranoside ligase